MTSALTNGNVKFPNAVKALWILLNSLGDGMPINQTMSNVGRCVANMSPKCGCGHTNNWRKYITLLLFELRHKNNSLDVKDIVCLQTLFGLPNPIADIASISLKYILAVWGI